MISGKPLSLSFQITHWKKKNLMRTRTLWRVNDIAYVNLSVAALDWPWLGLTVSHSSLCPAHLTKLSLGQLSPFFLDKMWLFSELLLTLLFAVKSFWSSPHALPFFVQASFFSPIPLSGGTESPTPAWKASKPAETREDCDYASCVLHLWWSGDCGGVLYQRKFPACKSKFQSTPTHTHTDTYMEYQLI